MTQHYQDQVREVKKKYLLGLPEKAEKISAQWLKLININWQVDWLIALQQKAHQLAGTAGAFGFDEMGACAKEIDVLLDGAIHESHTNELDRQKMSALIEKLQALISEAARYNLSADDMPYPINLESNKLAQYLIYIVDDDESLCSMLALHLKAQGYAVQTFSFPQECLQAIRNKQPSLILMDVSFPVGSLAGIETVSYIQAEWGKKIPVVFMSVRSDMVARLKALRSGGSAYLTKPLNMDELKKVIEQVIDVSQSIKPKVMIVDDDADLAEKIALMLNHRGFNTDIISKPLQCLEAINKIKPDILIIDMHMPTITGMELLQVIRQSSETAHLPVIFLTADNKLTLHQDALINGADVVLDKTVDVAVLEAAINETLKNAYRKNPFLRLSNTSDTSLVEGEKNIPTMPSADQESVKSHTRNSSASNERYFDEELPVAKLHLSYMPFNTVENKSSGIYDSSFSFVSDQGERVSASKLMPEIESKRQFWNLDRWILQQAMRDLRNDSEKQFVTHVCIHISNVSLLKNNIADVITEFLQQFDDVLKGKLIFAIEENWLIRYPEQGLKFCLAMKSLHCHVLLNNCSVQSESISWLEKGIFDFAKLQLSTTKMINQDMEKQSQLKIFANTALMKKCEIIAANVDDQQTLSLLWQMGIRLFV